MRPFRLLLVLVVLSAALLAVVRTGYFEKSPEFSLDPDPLATGSDTPDVPRPSSPPLESEDRREPTPEVERGLEGTVRSADGRAVEGARVVWIALKREDVVSTAWPVADSGTPDRKATETQTDSEGRFEFLVPNSGLPFGAVLTATHPRHHPGGFDLLGDSAEWPTNPEIVLEPASPIRVEVVDALGKPQAGATVHHAARPRPPTTGAPQSPRIYECFLVQEAITRADGRVELPPFRGEQALWAVKEELRSVPWQGSRPLDLVLTLGESFTVEGTISFSDLEQWESCDKGERRILISGLSGNLWKPLARQRCAQGREWGPLRVPLSGISRYKARLEGAPIISVEESFDRPRPSSHRRIDFVAERGVEFYLSVQDESGQPVPTAHGEAWWEQTMHPNVSIFGDARSDGEIRLGSVPSGWIRFRVAAPGYATQDLEAEVWEGHRMAITLQKGGVISGQCVHGGRPVADFEVIYWRTGNVRIYRSASFFGREDGHFEIESLEPGDWSIHAASPTFPSGPAVTVSVSASGTTEVELELLAAIRGAGRIVAADSGDPVPNAHVQPFSSGGLERGLPWGPGVLSDQDGSFDLEAFAFGSNYITVEARGFAMANAESALAKDAELLDWGDVRLVRPQALQISLLGLESLQELGPEDLRARTEEGHILPEKRFDGDGIVRFEDVPPGDHRLLVYYPDGSWARLQLRLDPGADWEFDLKIAGDKRLTVHVADSKGQPLSFVPSVLVAANEDTGVLVVRWRDTEKGTSRFEGIRAAKAQVFVLDAEFQIIASRDIAFGSDLAKEIEIRVGEKPFRVHVVDADRASVSDAHVTIRSATGVEIHGVGNTGADGWADLAALPASELLMDVQHGVLGRHFGVPIDASAEELEFVLEASGSLELELLDGSFPLAGVATRIETKAGLTLGDARQTDDGGRVRYESLGQGTYHLACRRADCWPAAIDEDLAPDEDARVQVQMRRLADLEFTLFSSDGLPVSGMTVEFTSDEFELAIETWIQDEKVRAPTGLTTDPRGIIRVEGLPRGVYTWSVPLEDEPLTGSFDLVPAQGNRVSAFLPR